jgi:hypothetical protein
LDAVLLAGTTCAAFAALESYVHWRAGMGLHALHCLSGPAHRNAIPIMCALALLAAAVRAVLRHVLAWMHRVVVLLSTRRRALPQAARTYSVPPRGATTTLLGNRIRVRGPPRVAVPG